MFARPNTHKVLLADQITKVEQFYTRLCREKMEKEQKEQQAQEVSGI